MRSKRYFIGLALLFVVLNFLLPDWWDPIAAHFNKDYKILLEQRKIYESSISEVEDVIQGIEMQGSKLMKENLVQYKQVREEIEREKNIYTPQSFLDYLVRRYFLKDSAILEFLH